MKLAAVIGWPVAQSLSPAIHTAAFSALGLDWTFAPVAIRPGALEEGRGLVDTLGVDAASVTMPHKEGVLAWCSERSDLVERLGAVNALTRLADGSWRGDNTDVEGFASFLGEEANLSPRHALVVGAGGAARAIAVALADAGAEVTVTARRPDQAAQLVPLDPERITTAAWGRRVSCDLIVQTTPVVDDTLPEAYRSFPKGRAAIELRYGPPESAFLAAARASGAAAFDGLGMLLRQAASSFRIWTGVDAPLGVMRDAAEAELARRSR
jgi:shikimate dehydrogenase